MVRVALSRDGRLELQVGMLPVKTGELWVSSPKVELVVVFLEGAQRHNASWSVMEDCASVARTPTGTDRNSTTSCSHRPSGRRCRQSRSRGGVNGLLIPFATSLRSQTRSPRRQIATVWVDLNV